MPRSQKPVSDADVHALREYLADQRGQIIRSVDLHSRYATLVRADGREPASQLAVSRALTKAGWQRTPVRRGRGPRGKRRWTVTAAFAVPGAPVVPIEDYRMGIVLAALLGDESDAMIRPEAIWGEYQAQARQHGWSLTMRQGQVTEWLNEHNIAATHEGGKKGKGGWRGQPVRFIDRSKVDRISGRPPAAPVIIGSAPLLPDVREPAPVIIGRAPLVPPPPKVMPDHDESMWVSTEELDEMLTPVARRPTLEPDFADESDFADPE